MEYGQHDNAINALSCWPHPLVRTWGQYDLYYRVHPYKGAIPNRHASPCSNKHTTSVKRTNSHQLPDKTSIPVDCQETLNSRERESCLFGCRTCANRHFLPCKQRLCYRIYACYQDQKQLLCIYHCLPVYCTFYEQLAQTLSTRLPECLHLPIHFFSQVKWQKNSVLSVALG